MKNDSGRFEKNLSSEDLKKILDIAYSLKNAVGSKKYHEIDQHQRSMLIYILGYLLANINNPQIDKDLLEFLLNICGYNITKDKDKELEEEEKEQELEEKDKERRNRLAAYEVYKILNPHQLAGETALENFVNNMVTRGIKVALKYEGKQFAESFEKSDLAKLESHKTNFVNSIKNEGFKGGGAGLG